MQVQVQAQVAQVALLQISGQDKRVLVVQRVQQVLQVL